ncbi:hypothetical protein F4801DRAFT_600849 [Xylaria longipes]|nr:hypothetical protein F4801DRAFT_600849 [Xylaria longipes]RYC62300.1 hypothetical protein CHU98_g3908 [Xylaria longipes]
MDYYYRVRPAVLEVVAAPSFDVIRDRTGVLVLEPVGPLIHPLVNGEFQFICRVQDSVAGRVYAPRFGARLRATAYIATTALRTGATAARGLNYRLPLKDEEKAKATAAHCRIAYKPTDSGGVRAGIYLGLDLTFVWPDMVFIYIELEWVAGAWTAQIDSQANYGTPPIEPKEERPSILALQARQQILNELAPYWLKLR